ncbi:hypothetical protein KXX44_006640 [Aspergillus fumigatus]|nr:hypothetical protein KXX44_006640 [Aspergillus fumigatus]
MAELGVLETRPKEYGASELASLQADGWLKTTIPVFCTFIGFSNESSETGHDLPLLSVPPHPFHPSSLATLATEPLSQSHSSGLAMDDTPTGAVCKMWHNVSRWLKKVFTRRNKYEYTPPTAPDLGSPKLSTEPDAKNGSVDIKIDSSKTDYDAKDYWQMAYNELSKRDQDTLTTLLPATAADPQEAGRARTKEILNRVIKATKTQYSEAKGEDAIQATANKILSSAQSFQDVVSNAVKFDPTGYASSAWAVVSLGLTMAKNHADLREALFDSSGYLADLLARCAFIEEHFYRGSGPGTVTRNTENERSILRVYVAILRYSAEVRRAQQFNKGQDIVESITAVTSQQLAQLKSLIKEEETHLHNWLHLAQHLRRKAEAEKLAMDIQKVDEAVGMRSLPLAKGAFFGSFEDQHEDECLPGTRTDLLQQVQEWGRSSDRCIFWLSGMAGTGKSTIARTVARSFKEDGILGASFFFKRGEGDRGSAAKFFPTIVKLLAVHIPQMTSGIQKAIHDDPAISGKSLREQFDKLMLQPLLTVDQVQASTTTVIVIDALDECDGEEDVEIILELLPKVEKATGMPIRFFLTSRPESPIRFGFDQIGQSDYQNTILQNLDDNIIKHDITLYLREEFSKIRLKRQRVLPPGWPGEERIEALATMAVPLFIFAATVCRFVADKNWNPEKRLQQFFMNSSGSKMDRTYRPILNQLITEDESDMDELVEEFHNIIGVIILLAAPLSLSALAELLEMPEPDISNVYLLPFNTPVGIGYTISTKAQHQPGALNKRSPS